MSKFLRLVENNLPSEEEAGMGKMVDKLVELLDSIDSIIVTSDVPAQKLTIDIDGHRIVLEVKDVQYSKDSEDEESSMKATYNLNQGVEGLATQASTGIAGAIAGKFGSVAQKAKQAVKRRNDVAVAAIPVYDKVTQKLEQAIRSASRSITAQDQTVI